MAMTFIVIFQGQAGAISVSTATAFETTSPAVLVGCYNLAGAEECDIYVPSPDDTGDVANWVPMINPSSGAAAKLTAACPTCILPGNGMRYAIAKDLTAGDATAWYAPMNVY